MDMLSCTQAKKRPNQRSTQRGFTIVELLIVIVVIAILASISIVAYVGIQQRAREVVLTNDLRQASTHMEIEKTTNGAYPAVADSIPKSATTEYEYRPNGDSYCLAARTQGASDWSHHITNGSSITEGSCQGSEFAGAPPAGVNLAAPFSEWTLYGGATYNSGTKEITLVADSFIRSPFMKIDGPLSWEFSAEMNGPASPAEGANGRTETYMTARYYDASHNPYENIAGYDGNGHAPWVEPANTWTEHVWSDGSSRSGPGMMYIRFDIDVDGSYGVPGTKYRNPTLTITQ